MNRIITILLLLLLLISIAFNVYQVSQQKPIEVIRDTISIREPKAIDTIYNVRTIVRKLPIINTDTIENIIVELDTLEIIRDSAIVEIPIEQRIYKDSTYTAWVSGYEPRLDSIKIIKTQKVVQSKTTKQKLGIEIQGGIGATPKGVLPYIGIGLGLRLF